MNGLDYYFTKPILVLTLVAKGRSARVMISRPPNTVHKELRKVLIETLTFGEKFYISLLVPFVLYCTSGEMRDQFFHIYLDKFPIGSFVLLLHLQKLFGVLHLVQLVLFCQVLGSISRTVCDIWRFLALFCAAKMWRLAETSQKVHLMSICNCHKPHSRFFRWSFIRHNSAPFLWS